MIFWQLGDIVSGRMIHDFQKFLCIGMNLFGAVRGSFVSSWRYSLPKIGLPLGFDIKMRLGRMVMSAKKIKIPNRDMSSPLHSMKPKK